MSSSQQTVEQCTTTTGELDSLKAKLQSAQSQMMQQPNKQTCTLSMSSDEIKTLSFLLSRMTEDNANDNNIKERMLPKLYPTVENSKDHLECINAEYAPYRFDYNDMDKATEYLIENGYVVIKNTLNTAELSYGLSLFWKFLESDRIGWNKQDHTTWDINKIGGKTEAGLCWGSGIAHTSFQWFNRKHDKVRNIFAKIWNHSLFPDKNNNKKN